MIEDISAVLMGTEAVVLVAGHSLAVEIAVNLAVKEDTLLDLAVCSSHSLSVGVCTFAVDGHCLHLGDCNPFDCYHHCMSVAVVAHSVAVFPVDFLAAWPVGNLVLGNWLAVVVAVEYISNFPSNYLHHHRQRHLGEHLEMIERHLHQDQAPSN